MPNDDITKCPPRPERKQPPPRRAPAKRTKRRSRPVDEMQKLIAEIDKITGRDKITCPGMGTRLR